MTAHNRFVTVTDETPTPTLFTGILLGEPCPEPAVDEHVDVLVGVTGPSGFGFDNGPQIVNLKKLPDGHFGA